MPKLFKKYWWMVLIIAFSVVLTINHLFIANNNNAAADAKKYIVKRQTLQDELSFSGKVQAQEQATLRFQSSGMLTWVGVKEGDQVKKYQAIASVDQRDLKKRLEKYLNTFSSQRTDLDQSRDDNQDKELSGLTQELRDEAKRAMEKAQFDLNNAVLDVELQSLSIEYSTLYAPFDGIVASVGTAQPGVNITPSQAEFEVINPDSLYFSAAADQTDVVKLHESMQGTIIFDAYPDNKIEGRISYISFTPKTDESGTVYEVKIAFDPTTVPYKLGMTGDATFVLSQKPNIIVVPDQYVHTEKGTIYVWRDNKGKKEKTIISIGDSTDSGIEVKKGLAEGDIIYDTN